MTTAIEQAYSAASQQYKGAVERARAADATIERRNRYSDGTRQHAIERARAEYVCAILGIRTTRGIWAARRG